MSDCFQHVCDNNLGRCKSHDSVRQLAVAFGVATLWIFIPSSVGQCQRCCSALYLNGGSSPRSSSHCVCVTQLLPFFQLMTLANPAISPRNKCGDNFSSRPCPCCPERKGNRLGYFPLYKPSIFHFSSEGAEAFAVISFFTLVKAPWPTEHLFGECGKKWKWVEVFFFCRGSLIGLLGSDH